MNPTDEQYLKGILAKDPNDLTEYDKGFLKARISYLGKNSRSKFASILNEKPQKQKKVAPEVPATPVIDPLAHPAEQEETQVDTDDTDDELEDL